MQNKPVNTIVVYSKISQIYTNVVCFILCDGEQNYSEVNVIAIRLRAITNRFDGVCLFVFVLFVRFSLFICLGGSFVSFLLFLFFSANKK